MFNICNAGPIRCNRQKEASFGNVLCKNGKECCFKKQYGGEYETWVSERNNNDKEQRKVH